jgi:hypothetical protein
VNPVWFLQCKKDIPALVAPKNMVFAAPHWSRNFHFTRVSIEQWGKLIENSFMPPPAKVPNQQKYE